MKKYIKSNLLAFHLNSMVFLKTALCLVFLFNVNNLINAQNHPIDDFLNANPHVAEEVVWCMQAKPLVTVKYANWDPVLKTELHNLYDDIANGIYPSFTHPFNNLYDDGFSAGTRITMEDGKSMYLAYLATSLYFEINNTFSWSITEYDQEEIQAIVHYNSMLTPKSDAENDFTQGFSPTRWSLFAPPAYLMSNFYDQNNIIDPTSAFNTYGNIADYTKSLRHFTGGYGKDDFQNHWQYHGAIPAQRIIDGTTRQSDNLFAHFTAGCHGTASFHEGITRLINIPAYYLTYSGHAVVQLPTLDNMFTTHADDFYNQITRNMDISNKHLLVNKHYATTHGPGSQGPYVGSRVIDLDINELSNYTLSRFCNEGTLDYTNSYLDRAVSLYGVAFLDSIRYLDRILYALNTDPLYSNCGANTSYEEYPINWTNTINASTADNHLVKNDANLPFEARSNTLIENGHWVESVVYNTQPRTWLGIDAATVDQGMNDLEYATVMFENNFEVYNNGILVFASSNPYPFTLAYLKISIENNEVKFALNGHTLYQQALTNPHLEYTVFAGGDNVLSEINKIVSNSQLTATGNCVAGTACDDGDSCTDNDVFDANCGCVGSTNLSLTGRSCDDNNPCTIDDVYDANCNCIGTLLDTDGDGICDGNDICPDQDNAIDADEDGVPDLCDNCPGGDNSVDTDSDGIPDLCELCSECIATISTFPYVEDFEEADYNAILDSICQNINDDFDWGPLGTNTYTPIFGPAEPYEGQYFIFLDPYGRWIPNKTSSFVGLCYDLPVGSNVSLDFRYHMYGQFMGTLNLDISNDGGLSWTEVWSMSGDQGNNWLHANVDLSAYAGSVIKYKFTAITGISNSTEMGLDNITMNATNVNCTPGASCNDSNACTTGDVYDANCNCVGTFADADNDGVCDATDICPGGDDTVDTDNDGTPDACDNCSTVGQSCDDGNNCTTGETYDANCNCTGGTFQDADNDGVCDADDICPSGDDTVDTDNDGTPDACDNCSTVGQSCNDNDSCTTNDVYDANCNCVGVFMDADNDGVCDANDICPGGDDTIDTDNDGTPDACDNCSTAGQACNDNDICTTNDVYDANCNCVGVFMDADNDGVCDANDICPGGDDTIDTDNDGTPDACDNCSTAGQACNDNDSCTSNDVYDANCNCVGVFMDTDNDGVCDANDICPGGDDTIDSDNDGTPDACDNCSTAGQACNDNDSCTSNDVYDANCNCVGVFMDADNDGVCDAEDICPGHNDTIDSDLDGTPDGCDDCVQCITTITQFPHTEDFELGLDNVCQSTMDEFDWMLHKGASASPETGPTAAYQGSSYLLVESSSPNHPYKSAIFRGPCFDLASTTTAELEFWYSMSGVSMGSLVLEVSTNSGIDWTEVWTRSGDQGTEWKNATVNLDGYTGTILNYRFTGTTETSFTSDIGLDLITLSLQSNCIVGETCNDYDECTINDSYDTLCNCIGTLADQDNDGICDTEDICPGFDDLLDVNQNGIPDGCDECARCISAISSFPHTEGFENGVSNICQSISDDFDWTLNSGATNSRRTGPSDAYEGDNYVFCEASSPNNPNKKATFRGSCYDLSGTSSANIDFWTHMYGKHTGTLELDVSTDEGQTWTSVWSMLGNRGDSWLNILVDLSDFTGGTMTYQFTTTTLNGYAGDIALDNITIATTSRCVAGSPCDDNDECTVGETLDSNCDCNGGISTDNDEDGYCAELDPNDNDPCVPEADPLDCDPVTSDCTVLDFTDFENGLGIWNDGGADAQLQSKNASSGANAIRLSDDSGIGSSIFTDLLALSSYESVIVSFDYVTKGMQNGEDFMLEVSLDGGSNFMIAKSWICGTDFNNNQAIQEVIQLDGYMLNNQVVLRIRCDASNNSDHVYLDDIRIEACGTATQMPFSISTRSSRNDVDELTLALYPNPVMDVLYIEIPEAKELAGTITIYSISGVKVFETETNLEGVNSIGTNHLDSDQIYMCRITTESGQVLMKKFIKL